MQKKQEKFSFNKSISDLENIIDKIESGDEDLDKTIDYFENGINIINQCKKNIEKAELRIKKLIEKSDDDFETESIDNLDDETYNIKQNSGVDDNNDDDENLDQEIPF